ncbi:MAG: hypothetical protein WD049_05905 [Candidatus Paceibacterota bacterium]
MNSNLFVASTPLQLLNATEARNRFHSGQCNRLAVVRAPLRRGSPSASYHEILRSLIDDQWSDVWYPDITKLRQLAFSLTARSFIRSLRQVDALYVGSFQSPQCHLINSIAHNQLFLFDDGCSIHNVLQRLTESPGKQTWRHRVTLRKGAWPGEESVQAFTCFDVAWPKTRLIENDYRCLKDNLRRDTEVRTNEIVFIAQPISSELGLEVDYNQIINYLLNHTGCSKCRIINHPKDRNPPSGGEVLSYPIELFGMQEGYLPNFFATFFSTAVRTLKIIYDRPAICLEIDPKRVPHPLPYDLSCFYEDYRNSGFSIISHPQWADS